MADTSDIFGRYPPPLRVVCPVCGSRPAMPCRSRRGATRMYHPQRMPDDAPGKPTTIVVHLELTHREGETERPALLAAVLTDALEGLELHHGATGGGVYWITEAVAMWE